MRFLLGCIFSLSLISLSLFASVSHGQTPTASYALDADASAVQGSAYDGSTFGAVEFVTDAGRQVAQLPEGDGVLTLPTAVSELLDDAASFELRFDFKVAPPSSGDLRNILSLRTPCSDWILRCPGMGIASWGSDQAGFQQVILNFVDGKQGEVPDHPANAFDDNIKWPGLIAQDVWHSASWQVDPGRDAWRLQIGDQVWEGNLGNPSGSYVYDNAAIMSHVVTSLIHFGGEDETTPGTDVQPIWFDDIAIYVPGTTPSISSPAVASTITGQSVELSWTSLAGATGYDLEFDNNEDFLTPELVTTSSEATVSIDGLPSGSWYWRVRGNWNGSVGAWATSRFTFVSTSELISALQELEAHVDGSATQAAARLEELLTTVDTGLEWGFDDARNVALAFLAAYETARPPLFEDDGRVTRASLPPETRAVYVVMDHIQAREFVNDRVTDMAGVAFEAREAFPGAIDPAEPRLSNAEVSWDGTYHLNPNIILTASEFVVRPSGYWAPAGELVTVTLPQHAVDTGISILVGAHFRVVTDDLGTQNRFHDIGTEFPVDRTTMTVANPFGGGIYLKVPDGTDLGTLQATISGAVKSAYYSHRTGPQSDVVDWVSTLAATSVPWVDLESDRFMTTLSLDMARGVDNPDDIMERWDILLGQHSELAGRTEPNGRAEFYILDRQLVTPAFGAGYPVTIDPQSMSHSISGDLSHDSEWGTWNPLRVVTHRPNFIFLHELGHNLLLNEFLYPDGISFTSESSVHIWASKIYHTVYGMDPDDAFNASSYQRMTMDLAAMDRMLTYNFRNDFPMGHDPTRDPSINDEIRYQHRGHGPIVDFAWLFGWDKLGETYGLFYDGTFPAAPGSWPHVRTRDQLVEASSMVTGVDTSPFWYFWGWYPSEELRTDLAARFPQSPSIRDRIEYYRSLIPADAAEYAPWHDQFMALQDGVHTDRWTSYRDDYESSVRDEVLAQFGRILSMPVDVEEDIELPSRTELTAAYPNPFSRTVRIPFNLAHSGHVRLAVNDMLGREILVLLDEYMDAGRHDVRLTGDNLSAGVYLIRLTHSGVSSSRLITRIK